MTLPTYTEWLYSYLADQVTSRVGVYCILNVANDMRYVGSSVDMVQRASQHFKSLEEGVHPNRNLQHAFDWYGNSVFTFIVLEYSSEEELEQREQIWLDRLRRHRRTYNVQIRVSRPITKEKHKWLTHRSSWLPW